MTPANAGDATNSITRELVREADENEVSDSASDDYSSSTLASENSVRPTSDASRIFL